MCLCLCLGAVSGPWVLRVECLWEESLEKESEEPEESEESLRRV